MTEYYFFKIVFTKWQKLAQNQITHSSDFLWCGFPICLFVFITPQASPARVTTALGAFQWWHPISSAYPTSRSCSLETSRPTMLEP
jgi:hypothetical protein